MEGQDLLDLDCSAADSCYAASVTQAHQIRSLEDLARFRSRHVWSDAVVAERFHRWRDELHVLEVAVSRLPEPLVLPWRDDYGGCKSWVEW
jgi:hypothetical protein